MLSINRSAMTYVHQLLEDPQKFGVSISKLDNGCTVIDMGQQAKGGWLAGKYYALITLGGIAEVSFEPFPLDQFQLTAVRVVVDHPMEACIASQIAGWRLEARADAPMTSGPARALNRKNPDHYFDLITYRDHHHEGVIAIQTEDPISPKIAQMIAESCQLSPQNLYILVANNASLTTAVQVSARIIEQTLHRLDEEGFDINQVRFAQGYCVVPPLANDKLVSMGRINDALLYGGLASLIVDSEDKKVEDVISHITSDASNTYGQLFIEIYERYNRDFYQIPLDVHSPAAVQINNMRSGKSFLSGKINTDILRRSFF
ncbi:MAG: methenyltetrahydromethanopterin cyclohydrolase [Anaerolineae bacterium]|nr:methenyltetrahydromethanopterin cyclohydrolase [Anaerolineae bacterium]